MKILFEGIRGCRKGPEQWFTGTVWIDEVVAGNAPSRLKVNRVMFEPAARTAWHTHPVGQALHVVSGVGLVQKKGEAIQVIRSGDSVWIEANELHWHGAVPGRTFVHLAMQEMDERGVDVVWLDHVTEEEYDEYQDES
ncbi:(R)-mandelonitrile lyase [Granulicella arctica]|uniref:(R)-mandelonitrile lyase n=1 Tax=Granulicella arctica TaxID=940613 RepID=UPI0021DFE01A|nr:cupin domain-containing protein [Granulicella arctica]